MKMFGSVIFSSFNKDKYETNYQCVIWCRYATCDTQFVFGFTRSIFARRIENLKLKGHEMILDMGCGRGLFLIEAIKSCRQFLSDQKNVALKDLQSIYKYCPPIHVIEGQKSSNN